jgi:PKD domain-containing protein/phosphate-induced protein 1
MRRLGIGMRAERGWRLGAGLLVASVALCAVLASAAAAKIVTDPVTGHKFGIVPAFHGSPMSNSPTPNHASSFGRIAAAGTPTCDTRVDSQCATPMTYHNGPVQHGENVILFFWDPSRFSSEPGYIAGMQTWVNDLAAGDFSPGNVPGIQVGNPLSVTQQYFDLSGPGGTRSFVPYAVRNGGTVLDTDAYPPSGCTDSYSSGGQAVTLPICLTANQLLTELGSYVQAHNLPLGINTEYFILTPQGVGSCDDSSSQSCAFSTYCGWHTAYGSPSNPLLFADMPWQSGMPGCDLTGNASLHTTGIDPVVNTFSHELAETMTDPEENAWYGSGGGSDEIGDKCAYQFSVGQKAADPTGLSTAPGGQYYNATLKGDDYLLQMEYDNRAGGCNQWDTDTQPTAAMSAPTQASLGSPATFALSNVSAPAGIAYVTWYFGDGAVTRAASGGTVRHTYSSAGSRTVTAVLTDNDGNELKLVKALTVGGGHNSVVAHPPAYARVNRSYTIRLSGHASAAETLYAFLDYRGCAATPAIEHTRANGYIWLVQGSFAKNSTGKSRRAGQNHVCAYLVNRAEPKNPSTGILAHDFVTFTIHH